MRKLNLIALFFIAFVAFGCGDNIGCRGYDDALVVLFYYFPEKSNINYKQNNHNLNNIDSIFLEIEKQKIYPKVTFRLDGEIFFISDDLGIKYWTGYIPYRSMKIEKIVSSECPYTSGYGKIKKGRTLNINIKLWNEIGDSSESTADISINPNYVYGFFFKKDLDHMKWNDGTNEINLKNLECFNEICMFHYLDKEIVCKEDDLGWTCFDL